MKSLLPAPWPDAGNLFLRLGTGIAMIVHGWPKITGGTPAWEHSAAVFGVIGIHFWPVFWGFLVALSQTLGGALIALGFLARPAALMLGFVMALAAVMVFQKTGGNFSEWSHPGEAAVTCFAIFLLGTGRYSLGKSS